ncbi:MAG: transglycosylase domain-containing protein [bacterium]|nr:transglycosylase domain-containing protein [bacterium]
MKKFLKFLVKFPLKHYRYILTVIGGLLFVGLAYFFLLIKDLPDTDILVSRQVSESTKIYDRTGETLLYEIHGEEKRTIIPFEEIPAYAKQAAISIEDDNFYNHGAVDWKGILRAFGVNLLKGRIDQGGSTITQQLVKKAFLTDDRTVTRKIKELFLSIKLEKEYTKDEILSLYLNQIPYGSNAYGIEAASKAFFDKNAKDLNLAEAALLASLPKAPSYFSPYGSHEKELLARKNTVLEKMVESGFITEEEKEKAQKFKFKFSPNFTTIKAPHFVIMVQDYLNNKYGEDFVRTAGLEVITSLDWKLQEQAEKAVEEGAQRNEELYAGKNAALIAQDANTGQILALVGSRNYFDTKAQGNFNVAAQGLRQPGSTIKPFAYVAAFKKGYTPDTIVFDVETEFDNTGNPEKSYKPQNFDEIFRGPVTLRQGLSQSINIPSIKTLYLAGIDNFLKLTKAFGITTLTERSRYGLSLVLGGGEAKLIDLVNAYSVFAQDGIKHTQSLVLKVSDKERILEEYSDQPENVIEAQYARMINNILSDIESRSVLFQNSLGLTLFPNQEVALKTGTTNDYRDAWTIGYTKSLVVGVWAGNNDNTPMQKRGSSLLAAIPMWSSFMREALREMPTDSFAQPDPIYVEKPILKGEYVVNYWFGSEKIPQIHDILYYVSKNNPLGPYPSEPENDAQFLNWEDPTIAWAKINIPNFDQIYNKPIPAGAYIKSESESNLTLDLVTPLNGSFIRNPLNIVANIKSANNIKKVEVFFNDKLIDQQVSQGKEFVYVKNLNLSDIELQNFFKLTITDDLNNKTSRELILYK